MMWLPDKIVNHLKAVADLPDLGEKKYRIVSKLGTGGMGVIYVAEDLELDRKVALKILDVPDHSGELAARMLREAKIIARLEHPSIVPVHDAGTLPDGRVFYAMKLIQGTRLDQYVGRDTPPSGYVANFPKGL